MPPDELPRNDGWTDVTYDLGLDPEANARISAILNEACHVFHYHAGGTWKTRDKDVYAKRLADQFRTRRSLIRTLLNTEDRVVKSVTYRAIDFLDAEPEEAAANDPEAKR